MAQPALGAKRSPLEKMVNIFANRRVLVTGHTGFKGSWLSLLLLELGAQVIGYSKDFPTDPSLAESIDLPDRIDHHLGDIADLKALTKLFNETKPEFIFHLAAQPIVRTSYDDPKVTFETNVMGTVNLLECVRNTRSVSALINITTDKCYENKESHEGYRENDRLGGQDPYSTSKAASELVTASYQTSFFGTPSSTVIATARSGNVIGGGDWGEDRILPDAVRALSQNRTIPVRNPQSIRPWQHVLECLSGYLCLATQMKLHPKGYNGAWNFGPTDSKDYAVQDVVNKIIQYWGHGSWHHQKEKETNKSETQCLKLNCAKALTHLKWKPIWDTKRAVRETVHWYQKYYQNSKGAFDYCFSQIHQYKKEAQAEKIIWAT